jgi:hypothetical protein
MLKWNNDELNGSAPLFTFSFLTEEQMIEGWAGWV